MPKIIKKRRESEFENARRRKKPYRICDEEGLRLLVRPTGKKVWQVRYKFNGKPNTFTIGEYGTRHQPEKIRTAEARKIKDEIRALVRAGIDPNKHKKAEAHDAETTFEALGREWHGKGTWVPKHAKNILSSLEDDVFPVIGHKQIDKVTKRDIIQILEDVEQRGALDVAKRICQRCEAIFDYAMTKDVCDANPASGRARFIKFEKSKPRPHLKEHQIPDFLNALDAYHGRKQIRLALNLLMLTFLRPGELRHGRWEEIDFKSSLWRIPAKRMKMDRDHIIPLSTQAIDVLLELKVITGHSDFLFPSIKTPHKPISDVTLLKALKVMGYTGEKKIVPHGFRHTASTILNEHGFNRDAIERQLAHKEKNKIRATYNHAEYLPEREKMMQWYGDYLDELRAKGADG